MGRIIAGLGIFRPRGSQIEPQVRLRIISRDATSLSYSMPRLYCALASPRSAALRYHFTASHSPARAVAGCCTSLRGRSARRRSLGRRLCGTRSEPAPRPAACRGRWRTSVRGHSARRRPPFGQRTDERQRCRVVAVLICSPGVLTRPCHRSGEQRERENAASKESLDLLSHGCPLQGKDAAIQYHAP
jgi:hypothetical protein